MPSSTVLPPTKLAHVVLRTNNFEPMVKFWTDFLGGKIAWKSDKLAFIRYDDEHHRIAIFDMGPIKNKDFNTCGLEHLAFTYDTLRDLCTAYKQRKAIGMTPGWTVHHGPTLSMYWRDPDGNVIETQVDALSVEEAETYMEGPLFTQNAIGADLDPEELCAALDRGEDEAKLLQPIDIGPVDALAVGMEKTKQIQLATYGS